MCKALDDWSRRERSEGRAEGRLEGVDEVFALMKEMGVEAELIESMYVKLHPGNVMPA
ncbi:MAG: hypothetical protein IJ225_01610 [Solobacterium sp.]|nr:hypothetical protein [Solobacterium sp.]